MRSILKAAANAALSPFNRELVQKGILQGRQAQYAVLVKDFEACFRELVCPELPAREGRAELMAGLLGTQVPESLFLLRSLHRSLGVEGDVCEFGVAFGGTSALIANEIRDTDKNLWLFDSFQGLSKPTDKDRLIDDIYGLGDIESYTGTMSYQMEEVASRVRSVAFPESRTRIVPGFIEESIRRASLPGRVCFAYVDFDFYEPILTALNFLDEHLARGGHIVVDDYGFFSEGAKVAVDEFVEAHPGKYDVWVPPASIGHFAILELRANG